MTLKFTVLLLVLCHCGSKYRVVGGILVRCNCWAGCVNLGQFWRDVLASGSSIRQHLVSFYFYKLCTSLWFATRAAACVMCVVLLLVWPLVRFVSRGSCWTVDRL